MSRHGLEIRAASVADAPWICEMLANAGHPVPAAALAARLGAIRQSSGTVLLALEWGPPSGIVALHWYPTLAQDRLTAVITTLLVGSDSRRRGIGRLLVKAAAQAARVAGCDTLDITLGTPGQELAAFCRATGFTQGAASLTRALRKHPQA